MTFNGCRPPGICDDRGGGGTRRQTQIEIICSLHFLTQIGTRSSLSVAPPPLISTHFASPKAISLFWVGGEGGGWESCGEREDLSVRLNMDKLHYFFQPSVQSPPFFPIILRVNEVAWVMIEEEKNAPLLLLSKSSGRGTRIRSMYVF